MTVIDIAFNELRRLFLSPLAWLVLALVQFLLAMFFFVILSQYLGAPQLFTGRGITEIVVAGMFQIAGILLLLITPFITMRLFSEERRTGTIKLLLSSPVSVTELVLGKYLGVMLLMLMLLGLIVLMPLSLLYGTGLDLGQLASIFLALLLLMSTLSAAGLFISGLTKQPAVAAIGTFGVVFVLWIIHVGGNTGGGNFASLVSYLSMLRHYNNLLEGVFSSVDLFYYLILTAVFILLSIWRLDALRTHT